MKPTASITIDSTKIDAEKLTALEDLLYGTTETEATLPTPQKIIEIIGEGTNNEQPQG